MSDHGVFDADSPKVWFIPSGVPFLRHLAETLARATGLRDDPAALSSALIYVPNRRSARALALELFQVSGGRAILPPDIRALGDLETDEPPSGAEEALTDLGPAVPAAKRLGALARFVRHFYRARGDDLPVTSALAAAGELVRLLDQAAIAGGVDWSALPDLVTNADLSAHWQASVAFLEIVARQWPDWLAGESEPYERRLKVAEAIAAAVRQAPPDGPFVIAGSTGATPATRQLMQAAQACPRGLVVLPGLEAALAPDAWTAVAGSPDHPQHALAATLDALQLAPQDVALWPGSMEAGAARRRLIHESLAPATQTADWLERLTALADGGSTEHFVQDALDGLSVIEAADEADEALLAALLLREVLETPDKTAALVTPDAALARRISALLKRWGVDVPPSAGVPFGRTPSGSLMLSMLDWLTDRGDPARILSLLKHQLVSVPSGDVSALERYYFRGPRSWTDLGDLSARIDDLTALKNANRHSRVPAHAADLARGLVGRLAVIERAWLSAEPSVGGLAALIDMLAGPGRAWIGPDGAAAARLLEAAGQVVDQIAVQDREMFCDVARALSASVTVQMARAEHPRLSIWGPLEARLQSADRLILAGLNEGVWPDYPSADGFLPRRFREPLGLALPEALLGLAAHDFAGLATAPDVTLLYAARRDDAPAVPSRWVMRLKTLAQGALGSETDATLQPAAAQDPRVWAAALTDVARTTERGSARPHPRPEVAARPSTLSVTRINTLQRDPYAIYAESVLGLKRLRTIGEPVDAGVRGTAIHLGLEAFSELPGAEQSPETLVSLVEAALRRHGQAEHIVVGDHASLTLALGQVFNWWQERADRIKALHSEVRGALDLEIAGAPFRLTGVADRIEQLADGTLAIFDFKTGKIPTRKEIAAGFEQQMPLLALLAQRGSFDELPAGQTSVLGYVGVKAAFEAVDIAADAETVSELAEAAEAGMFQLITDFRREDTPFLSAPRVQLKASYAGDFDRLARRGEWAGEAGDD